jgi:hypothetical protein
MAALSTIHDFTGRRRVRVIYPWDIYGYTARCWLSIVVRPDVSKQQRSRYFNKTCTKPNMLRSFYGIYAACYFDTTMHVTIDTDVHVTAVSWILLCISQRCLTLLCMSQQCKWHCCAVCSCVRFSYEQQCIGLFAQMFEKTLVVVRCQWHRCNMHKGVIDTAVTCTAVSLTPLWHAPLWYA